jgi:glycosyltransferase involved in cell wall biosynthesis
VSDPLVSVIIPCYDCASTVRETVASVFAQDFDEIEVIAVNDGSRDDTLAVLRSMEPRIRVIDQPNSGPPEARNAGMAAARGEYIAFVDADDLWLPGKLSAQVGHLERHPDVGVVFAEWHVWRPDADGQFRPPAALTTARVTDTLDEAASGWLYPRLLLKSQMLTSTVLLRASLARQVGPFDRSLRNGEDYDYWLRLSRVTPLHKLAAVGVLYRQLPGSESNTPKDTNFELTVVRRALERWGTSGPDGQQADPKALQRRLRSLELEHGYAHLRRGKAVIAWDTYRRAVRQQPWQLGHWKNAGLALAKLWRTGAA